MTESDEAADARERAEFDAAFSEARYAVAFATLRRALMRRAIALLGAEGHLIEWIQTPKTTAEFAGGIATALEQELERQGEQASYRLLIARNVAAAVAMIQERLLRPSDPSQTAEDATFEAFFCAFQLGAAEVHLSQTEGGIFDEYARLRWREHSAAEGRRQGAVSTNDLKRRQRNRTLSLARDIVSANPTLSNDELAFKLKARAELSQATRTITGWIRQWRKGGQLPPQR